MDVRMNTFSIELNQMLMDLLELPPPTSSLGDRLLFLDFNVAPFDDKRRNEGVKCSSNLLQKNHNNKK